MDIIKTNFNSVDIDTYPPIIFDEAESILHNSVNAHNYDLKKKYCSDNKIKVLEVGCGSYSFFKKIANSL